MPRHAAATRLLRRPLGLEQVEESPEWVELQIGYTRLALRHADRSYDIQRDMPGQAAQLAFRVRYADIERWHDHARDHNIRIL
jgi:hypothetical protein